MKSPTVLVTAALVVAIVVATSLLIVAGTRGEEASPYDRSWDTKGAARATTANPNPTDLTGRQWEVPQSRPAASPPAQP